MESIRDDVIGGFNAFLGEQKKVPSAATLTLVQFDSQAPYEVLHHIKPLANIPELSSDTYVPRASTPLLDAVGRGINDLNAQIARMPEIDKPGKVIFVIITDGMENASCEFTREQVSKMISDNETNNKWEFVFLSADFAAFNEAQALGFSIGKTAYFNKTGKSSRDALHFMSDKVSKSRMYGAPMEDFTDEERKAMIDTENKNDD